MEVRGTEGGRKPVFSQRLDRGLKPACRGYLDDGTQLRKRSESRNWSNSREC